MRLLSSVARPWIFWILLVETCPVTHRVCESRFGPWAKHKVEWTMSPAGCKCICSGQTSPEGFKVFFTALSTIPALASFTGCNAGNCNIQNTFVFSRQWALWKMQSALKPYSPSACFVGRDLGCNKLLKLCCSDEKAKYGTVTIVECAYSI